MSRRIVFFEHLPKELNCLSAFMDERCADDETARTVRDRVHGKVVRQCAQFAMIGFNKGFPAPVEHFLLTTPDGRVLDLDKTLLQNECVHHSSLRFRCVAPETTAAGGEQKKA